MTGSKEIWFGVGAQTSPDLMQAVYHRNYSCIWLRFAHREVLTRSPLPRRMSVAVSVDSGEELQGLAEASSLTERASAFFTTNAALLPELREMATARGAQVGLAHRVVDQSTLEASLHWATEVDVLLLNFRDPTNIPLELVLATAQELPCRVLKEVTAATDGIGSMQTMESGADAVVLFTEATDQIAALDAAFARTQRTRLSMVPATITGIQHVGMGDRVCIDTTSELFQDEGMIVGSTSAGGLVPCSETHYLPYMNLRPFRVNAGALHLYVWGPENRASYLSDLRAGDEVLVVNHEGMARTVTIGRLKIERRPLLFIEAEAAADGEGATETAVLNTFIQDDWHVRMMAFDGTIRPSRELEIGEKLLAYRDVPGRHVGIAIRETIREV